MTVILISILFSLIASLLSSMLGGGFGLISVPSIYWMLTHFYPAFPDKMQMAITTGSACSIVLGLMGSYKHAKYKNIDYQLFRKAIIAMIIGAIIGSFVMTSINSGRLKVIFAILVFIIAIIFSLTNLNKQRNINLKNYQFKSISALLGGISVLLGISVFNVPFFSMIGVKLKQAIGTSMLLVFLYSLSGTIGLVIIGIIHFGIGHNHIGYLVIPIWLSTIIPCAIGSMLGAKLVHHLPQSILKKIFVSLMIVVSISMLF